MKVKINLKNGFYYIGTIIDENSSYITLRDIIGKKVTISKNAIEVMEESR